MLSFISWALGLEYLLLSWVSRCCEPQGPGKINKRVYTGFIQQWPALPRVVVCCLFLAFRHFR